MDDYSPSLLNIALFCCVGWGHFRGFWLGFFVFFGWFGFLGFLFVFLTWKQETNHIHFAHLGFFPATYSTFWDTSDAQTKYLWYIPANFLLTNNPAVSTNLEDLFLSDKKERSLLSCCSYINNWPKVYEVGSCVGSMNSVRNIRKLLLSVSSSLLINSNSLFQQPQTPITETWWSIVKQRHYPHHTEQKWGTSHQLLTSVTLGVNLSEVCSINGGSLRFTSVQLKWPAAWTSRRKWRDIPRIPKRCTQRKSVSEQNIASRDVVRKTQPSVDPVIQ